MFSPSSSSLVVVVLEQVAGEPQRCTLLRKIMILSQRPNISPLILFLDGYFFLPTFFSTEIAHVGTGDHRSGLALFRKTKSSHNVTGQAGEMEDQRKCQGKHLIDPIYYEMRSPYLKPFSSVLSEISLFKMYGISKMAFQFLVFHGLSRLSSFWEPGNLKTWKQGRGEK